MKFIKIIAVNIFIIFTCSSTTLFAEYLGKDKNLEMKSGTTKHVKSSGGMGSKFEYNLNTASQYLVKNDLVSANETLDDVLNGFNALMTNKNSRYICFKNTNDFNNYISSRNNEKFIRLHASFADALFYKAFIASAYRDWNQAIKFLNLLEEYAPNDIRASIERGFIYNGIGKTEIALKYYQDAYTKALVIGETDKLKAVALRGIGVSLIELNRLDEAESVLRKSLTLDTESQVAIKEIKYIYSIKNKKDNYE